MSIYNQPNLTSGIDGTFVEIAATVPSFIIGLLVFVFGFVFITGTATQKAKTGHADMPMWAVMASISTLIVTLLLSIKSGLINIETLAIVISITVFSGLWLFFK